jgi:pimeloyl-ACP methyl ester carboxylesterase
MAQEEEIPVVLLHGWGGSFQHTWHGPGIDALLQDSGRMVLGIDLLGHGSAEKPHSPEAYENLGEWLLEAIPKEFPVVDVVGFSLGALTVLDALLASPHRFRKVLLAGIGNGVFENTSSQRHQRIVDALEGVGSVDDTFSQMFVQYAHQPGNDPVALTAIMKRPASRAITPTHLSHLAHEVLVVIGDNDFAAPADALASAFAHGSLRILKNTDHFATTESFSFIDALLDFLTHA